MRYLLSFGFLVLLSSQCMAGWTFHRTREEQLIAQLQAMEEKLIECQKKNETLTIQLERQKRLQPDIIYVPQDPEPPHGR